MIAHPDETIMRELIQKQWQKHSIYAAVVDEAMTILAIGTTTVVKDNDPTAHAEVNALLKACQRWAVSHLPKGCWLYSTFEPCPLCASACIWAGIEGIVYANNPTYRGKLADWSFIPCTEVIEKGTYLQEMTVVPNFLLAEIKEYFTRHEQ